MVRRSAQRASGGSTHDTATDARVELLHDSELIVGPRSRDDSRTAGDGNLEAEEEDGAGADAEDCVTALERTRSP